MILSLLKNVWNQLYGFGSTVDTVTVEPTVTVKPTVTVEPTIEEEEGEYYNTVLMDRGRSDGIHVFTFTHSFTYDYYLK